VPPKPEAGVSLLPMAAIEIANPQPPLQAGGHSAKQNRLMVVESQAGRCCMTAIEMFYIGLTVGAVSVVAFAWALFRER
jgi:hypothetical protein